MGLSTSCSVIEVDQNRMTRKCSAGLMENLVSLELEDNQIEGTLPPGEQPHLALVPH
jgi:hypothetical protein